MSDTLQLFLKIFSRAMMLLLVLPVTNCARGLVARWQGDDSADRAGRITLNPVVHLDLLGSLAILLCGFGWSKPMPINPMRMKNYKKGVILVSLAGPVSHFLSAIILMNINAVFWNCINITSDNVMAVLAVNYVISTIASINICLGVINILPLPPMDGFTVLHQLAGNKFNRWYYENYKIINQASFIIILILFFIGDLTDGRIDPLMRIISWVSNLLGKTTFWVPKVFG
ncbi:MAG: site-2 protease family protein [Alistipes sp.]|nr:site-2 protease family protein [Alistipes sp.]